ncbi:unnamed protein product [Fraxinus pennsylvanica]|uniref:Photosystem II core complex proteins psbY, chloroplastic n=1 Tax=Fraxinus pennsylvanica TaxID=56036 RepID=A0AAD2DS01_9LAMI|nr:unnamed protein product [Fraxinus pennsylvanica]
MAATMTTVAMINAKCFNTDTKGTFYPSKKSLSLLSMQNHPRGLTTTSKPLEVSGPAGTALAGVIFSTLSSSDAAFAAQQIADIAEGDNRGLALLLPIIPAIAWVLYNILQPALNQINKMRSVEGVIIGLGGLVGSSFVHPPESSASEIAMIADATANDNRGQLLLFVVIPAILWVLYNILQPALNQINRMRSD